MSNLTKIDKNVDQFRDALTRGIAAIKEACDIYVRCIDDSPEAKQLFIDSCPEIDQNSWAGFEAVGRHQIDHRLLLGSGVVCDSMRKLPLSQQTAVLNNGVELLVTGGDVLNAKVQNLTPRQRKQVFAKSHIRSLPEQRTWIECQKRSSEDGKIKLPSYCVKRGSLHVYEPTKISKSELASILSEVMK